MARAPKPQPEAALPSITELGRMLGTIARREAAIDLLPVGRGEPKNEEERRERRSEELRLKTADALLFRRLDALRDVVATLPARDLADCVVQVNVAGHMIMKITCNDLEKPELDELADAIERIMVSVLPVMAAAAGLDLAEFALDEVANLHEGRFPELAR